ncbi:MAG: sulfotransferase, partial [Pseudomonadota bacterium]|nr:sulfotransferase [Pseudomonadota bacterium]
PLVLAPSPIDQEPAAPRAQEEASLLPPAHLYEVGLTTAAMGFHTAAIEALRDCTARAPDHAAAWRKLAELLRLAAEDAQADAAQAAAERAFATTAQSNKAPAERRPGRPEKAEHKLRDMLEATTTPGGAMTALRDRLVAHPWDVAAMRLLANLEMRAGDTVTAWGLLRRALDVCPGYTGAREDYAQSLIERPSLAAAAAIQTQHLLEHAPRNPRYRMLHAYALIHTGKVHDAVDVLTGLLREDPREPRYWKAYAQALHIVGRRYESEQAFRKCLELRADMGEAYWGLADLKGRFITKADIAAIRLQLEDGALDSNSRMHMLYTLAHTLERAGDFAASFAAYEEGASLFRSLADQSGKGHDQAEATDRVRRMKAVFSREHLEQQLKPVPAATGCTPIFIVGMPRAGSTLVEQILASHSQVEGTRELPLIGDITRALAASRMLVARDAYPERILELTRDELATLGARVIERSGDYRTTDRPYFIDKRPWNWLDAGLIHLILPHAKIIDIRREPMAACFAMFKQVLPHDAAFSYDLDDLGQYYSNYVSLMEHWESVLPGRIHHVRYERLVEDTEGEIRRMLDYCGLPFDESCLRFWETERAVSTPSAEQVRRPIFRDALEQWRNFEPWLGPLRESLDRPAEA